MLTVTIMIIARSVLLLRKVSFHLSLTWLAAIALIALLGFLLYTTNAAFDSDEYIHATPALDLSLHLTAGEFGEFFQRLRSEVFYPPLHALFVAPFFTLFGKTPFIARVSSLAFYLLALLFTSQSLKSMSQDVERRSSVISVGLLFGIACPAAFLISSLVMLEPLGMALVGVLLMVFVTEKRSSLLVGVILSMLLLTKHTFGILIIPGIIVGVLWESKKEDLYVLLKILISALVIYCIWLLLVDTKVVFRFLFGHHARGYVFGLGPNLYYFKSLFYDFHLFTPLAFVGVMLALLGTYSYWAKLPVKVAFFSIVISFVLFGFIAERGPRHVVILAPYWWFLVGIGFLSLQELWIKKVRLHYLPLLLLAVTIFVSLTNTEWFHDSLTTTLERKPDQDKLIAELLPRIPTAKSYAIYGSWNLAFPYHLNWLVAARDGITVTKARKYRKVIPVEIRDSLHEVKKYATERGLHLIVVKDKSVVL